MASYVFTLPFRLGLHGAGLAAGVARSMAERALGLAGSIHDAVRPPPSPLAPSAGRDDDAGQRPDRPVAPAVGPAERSAPPRARARRASAESRPASAQSRPAPAHISEEATLVREVAEPGAEEGAGAEVRVAEPWDGYRAMRADDVIDRIRGASAAELAAVELYELSARRRQSVITAVQRELRRVS